MLSRSSILTIADALTDLFDLSSPGLRRALDKTDVESVWKWCHESFATVPASTRLVDRIARSACEEYRKALTRYPVLISFLGAKQ